MWSGLRSMLELLRKAYGQEKIRTGPEGKKLDVRDIAFYLQFIRPDWKLWALGFSLILLTMTIKSLIPMSSKFIIDFVILGKSPGDIDGLLANLHAGFLSPLADLLTGSATFIIASLVILSLAYGLMVLLQNYVTMLSQQKFMYNLQDRLLNHLFNLPMAFFKNRESGYLASRISTDVQVLQYLFSQYLPRIISDLAFMALAFFLIYGLSPSLTALLVIAVPLYIFINALFISMIRAFSRLDREVCARMSGDIQEIVSGVEVMKSFGSEKREAEKISDSMRYAMYVRIIDDFMISSSGLITKGAQFLVLILVLVAGIGQIRSGAITPGDYVAFISYVFMLSGTLGSLFNTMLFLQPIVVSMERIKELFATPSEFEQAPPGSTITPKVLSGHVKFRNVSFSYDGGKRVLEDASFEALPGDVVAIVGASGAGKTTLISLLLKFYRPMSGTICLDGVDLAAIDTRWLREQISVVSQDIFLFNDTVENNIRYGRPGASKEDVRRAATLAHIDEDIRRLPDAYGTVIGERGARMSPGQRQRISMARAFLKGSRIIVMDEPTSSLDAATEGRLKDSFRKLIKGKTAFIISHRASMADLANKVFVIEGGKAIDKDEKELSS